MFGGKEFLCRKTKTQNGEIPSLGRAIKRSGSAESGGPTDSMRATTKEGDDAVGSDLHRRGWHRHGGPLLLRLRHHVPHRGQRQVLQGGGRRGAHTIIDRELRKARRSQHRQLQKGAAHR